MITLTEIQKRAEIAFSDILSKEEDNIDKVNPKKVLDNPMLSILKDPNNIIPFISSDEFNALIALNLIASACEKEKDLKGKPTDESKIDKVKAENELIIKNNIANRFSLDEIFSLEKIASNIDLSDPDIESKLIKGLKIVTTHPIKHNEVNGKIDFAFNVEKDYSLTHGISSVNLKSESEMLTASGSAADLGSRYIFILRFVVDGKKTSVIEMLANDEPILIAAFEKAGMRTEFISELSNIAKMFIEKSFPDQVVGNQVFWRTGDEYTLISPIPSVQMISEQKSIQSKYSADKRLGVSLKSKAIGGANGQNSSQVNSQVRNLIFFSDLSFLNKKSSKLERKLYLENVPSLLKHFYLKDKDVAFLNKPLHTKAIRSHNTVVSSLVFTMLSDLMHAKDSGVNFEEKSFVNMEEKLFLLGLGHTDDYLTFESYLYNHYLQEMNFHEIEVVSDNVKVREIKRVIGKIVRSL